MAEMEIVRQFNSEVINDGCSFNATRNHSHISDSILFQLSTIYASKPPVSRAKVASITQIALKAVKVTFGSFFFIVQVTSVDYSLFFCLSFVRNMLMSYDGHLLKF